jgi:hypothetical protein
MKALHLGLSIVIGFQSALALAVETKITCPEVEATEAKCAEYSKASAACDAEVDAALKVKIDKAKTAADECKKKNGLSYMLKCKKEIKESTTAVNTPKQIASSPIMKEMIKNPTSACATSEALGKATAVCKSPAAVLEAMKRNCIK